MVEEKVKHCYIVGDNEPTVKQGGNEAVSNTDAPEGSWGFGGVYRGFRASQVILMERPALVHQRMSPFFSFLPTKCLKLR